MISSAKSSDMTLLEAAKALVIHCEHPIWKDVPISSEVLDTLKQAINRAETEEVCLCETHKKLDALLAANEKLQIYMQLRAKAADRARLDTLLTQV